MRIPFCIAVACLGLAASVAAAAEPPPFETVEATVREHVKELPGHYPNRLVTRAEVAPVLQNVAQLGWTDPGVTELLERFPPENDPLVGELRSKRAAGFAERIAGYPHVYDRLDRLRRMPYGDRRIRELSTAKGGEKLVRYLTTTEGGANLGRQIARGRKGRGFTRPTGRLYTFEDLIAELKRLHAGEERASAPGRLAR